MNERIRFYALGGLDEVGKSSYVVEIDEDIFVVGAGVRYPDRTQPGVDYVIPDYAHLIANKDRVKAYFLLHGHDDETGALAYIYDRVPAPIYGSSVTLALFKDFLTHIGKDPSSFDFHEIPPTGNFYVGKRRITYFQTSHNVALSSGVAINTSYGNLVFTGDFVIENNAGKNYLCDLSAVSRLSEEKTLALFAESLYAGKKGYTAPKHKLTPWIEESLKNAKGRVFAALFTPNLYNIDEVISLGVSLGKKIVPYDIATEETLKSMQKAGQLNIPRQNFAPTNDINRIAESDLLVLLLDYPAKIYRKIALLAAAQTDKTRSLALKETDTFILAALSDDNTELEATDALDELYRAGAKVINLPKKSFLEMHASEEDLKMMISLLRPKYYVPVRGLYKDLLENAQVAISMKGSLNHSNIFLLDNGLSLLFDETGAHLFDEKIPHGDILIDGTGVGDVGEEALKDRQKLAEGVVIIAATVSAKERRIVAGPDRQVRGFLAPRENDALWREVDRVFLQCLQDGLKNGDPLDKVRNTCYERICSVVRRMAGKEPMILPLIIEA